MFPNRLSYEVPYLLPADPPPIVTAAQSNNTLIAARCYAALGFSVLPLRGKQPALRSWRRYQHKPASPREITAWAQASLFGNLGIVCGAVSGQLVVLDLDGRAAYRAFIARFPHLAETFTVTTGSGRGRHVYLRVDRLPDPARALHTPLGNLELRSNGQLVVVPPSLHPVTGRAYTISRPFVLLHLPNIEEVQEWIISLNQPSPQPMKATAPPTRFSPQLVDAIANYFRAQGYKQNGDWLNGPCIYPERHANGDVHRSFGFNTRSGYGWCFTCQRSMLAKEIVNQIGI